jgi:phosphatidylserine synthase 2
MSPPLQQLYPELGVELPERQYGGDCALYIPGKGINWQVGAAALLPTYAPGSAAS